MGYIKLMREQLTIMEYLVQYEKFGISPDVEFLEDEFVLCVECGDLVTKEHFEQSGYETACPICCWDWEQQNYEYDEDEED